MNGIKMGVTSHIMDQNLSFIQDWIWLISAPDILTRDILTRTFHHGYFLARVLFSSAEVPANGHYVSKDIPAWGCYSTGKFRHRYISVQCQNVLVPKRPYCCAWCRNILVLKRIHPVMSRAEKSSCQKVPVPKCPHVKNPCAEKYQSGKVPGGHP